MARQEFIETAIGNKQVHAHRGRKITDLYIGRLNPLNLTSQVLKRGGEGIAFGTKLYFLQFIS